jgi:DNA uptake protein ComE-like DNA-binding protein
MKIFLGSFGAGLFVALAATFLLTRNRNVANERVEQRPTTDNVLPETERIAEEMRDEFIPGKLNTGQPSPELLDLNSCSIQDLLGIGGIDPEWAARIVEARPYRNKMDLLSRMVVPIDVFNLISGRVNIVNPDEAVKIA